MKVDENLVRVELRFFTSHKLNELYKFRLRQVPES